MATQRKVFCRVLRRFENGNPRKQRSVFDPSTQNNIQPADDVPNSDLHRFWSLDTMIQWLTVAKEASGIPPVPLLKACVGTALAIVQNLQLARANSEDFLSLMQKVDKLLRIILDPQSCPTLTTSAAEKILIDTHTALREIEPLVAGLSKKRSLVKGFFFASTDKAILSKYEVKIEEIRGEFRDKVLVHLLVSTPTAVEQPESYRILPQEDIELFREWRAAFRAWSIYDGIYAPTKSPVLVLKYQGGQTSPEEQEFLRVAREFRNSWKPNVPHFMGASRPTGDDRFIVLKGPQGDGRVAKYILSLTTRHQLEAAKVLIRMLQGLVSGAKHSLECTGGVMGLSDYDVYINESEQLVVYNFGLMLDPERNGPRLRLRDWRHWDAFIILFTKTLTNDSKQVNHTRGQIAPPRQPVFRLVRHLVNFAWDYSNTVGDQIRNTSTAAVTTMLDAFSDSLSKMETCLDEMDGDDENPLLTALVKTFGQKLSGIWDFDSPQNIATGDVGYMTGTPTKPRFVRLGNILNEIPGVRTDERPYQSIQYRPSNELWSEDVVEGVVRHKCKVASIPAKDTLFRVERGHRSGRLDESQMGNHMRWDCSRTWEYLLKNRAELCQRYTDQRSLYDHDLLLIFSHKQSKGHGMIRLISESSTSDERRAVLQSEGFDGETLYFFENVNPRHGELWGYWSREPLPGHPIWPPSIDADGPSWAWNLRTKTCRVEVSRTGPLQHIRYLQL